MVKIALILSFALLHLWARENPFFPSNEDVNLPITSNISKEVLPLQQASLTFPSTARTIESFTVTYKNLDGSMSTKTTKLQNTIDWHLPLMVSQSMTQATQKQSNAAIKKKEQNFKKMMSLSFLSFYTDNKALKIVSKDTMIRNFLLTQPHRIVCDFKNEISMRSYEKSVSNKKSIVKRVRIGNHNGYYRLVIELDGHYMYTTEKKPYGYLLKLL